MSVLMLCLLLCCRYARVMLMKRRQLALCFAGMKQITVSWNIMATSWHLHAVIRTQEWMLTSRQGRRSGVRPASWPVCRIRRAPLQDLRQVLRGYFAVGVRCWVRLRRLEAGPPSGRSARSEGILRCRGCVDREAVDVAQTWRLAPSSRRSWGSRHIGAPWRSIALSTRLAAKRGTEEHIGQRIIMVVTKNACPFKKGILAVHKRVSTLDACAVQLSFLLRLCCMHY